MIEAQREWKAVWPMLTMISSVLVGYIWFLLLKYVPEKLRYANSSKENHGGYFAAIVMLTVGILLEALIVELRILWW